MKSTESSHKGEKKLFHIGSFIPCCCRSATGYCEFATKAEKHFNFIYQTINNTKTTES